MDDKELNWRAQEAIIATGDYSEEQIERIRKGSMKPKALKIAIATLKGLAVRYTDPKTAVIREVVAVAHANHRQAILRGDWDHHATFRAAAIAFELGQKSEL